MEPKTSLPTPEDALLGMLKVAITKVKLAQVEPDRRKRLNQIDFSRRIVSELSSALNMTYGGEIAFNLLRLYLFINRRLADFYKGDETGAVDALRILGHVLHTWEKAIELANHA